MNFYTAAPIWNDRANIPDTSKNALPTKPLKVKGKVITVHDATYRGAKFSGKFLLAEEVDAADQSTRVVKVYCCWFKHRLKKDIPKFLINLQTSTITNNGVVYTDFSDGS